MTPKQKALVRRSWGELDARSADLSARFYQRLFLISPNARRLFGRKDMQLQGTLFVQMLALFIRSLEDDEPGNREAIQACGERHVRYGVTYSDYDGVGEALLWAVEEALKPRFGPDVREAWEAAYAALAGAMRRTSSNVL